jgi:DNA polymerase I-like protein with 3'-5' exonuclease and polymerase domains
MTALILDIENSISYRQDGGVDSTPFNPNNSLTSVGIKQDLDDVEVEYLIFDHVQNSLTSSELAEQSKLLQRRLDECSILVGHNIKYDLKWLLSCNFTFKGKVWDTMIFEYIMLRGMKRPLNLEACLERRGITQGKSDILKTYYTSGVNTNEIPLDKLVEYGKTDVDVTQQLYHAQYKLLLELGEKGEHYEKILQLMNDFLLVLVDMELAGVQLDINLLRRLEQEYGEELDILSNQLQIEIQKVMGDRPINLNSTDHKSQLLFSRKVTNKGLWKSIFNIGTEVRGSVRKKMQVKQYPAKTFASYVKNKTEPVYKTKARKCTRCDGIGHFYKKKRDDTNYKRPTKCPVCNGTGVEQVITHEVAGLGLTPLNKNVSESGFTTGSEDINFYLNHPRTPQSAKPLLEKLSKYNKLYTWKNTFVAQLLEYHHGGILHGNFNQTVTSTGRLSSTKPNLQNQPTRDPDFKIKKAFISRWEGGCITDADFGQLEFRIAAYLSQCPSAIRAVKEGLDIHCMTRDFWQGKLEIKPSKPNPDMTRQEAKADTFGPLYGKYTEWTEQFYLLFPGIKDWHERIMEEVMSTGELRSPSGRIYAFPNAKWFINSRGDRLVSGHTQIKNYTVQGFATGDVVLLVLIDIWRYLKGHNAKSKLILQVHDSAATDTHPDEYQLVEDAYNYAFDNVYAHAKERWGVDINIPLAFDLERGYNWGETKPIEEFNND